MVLFLYIIIISINNNNGDRMNIFDTNYQELIDVVIRALLSLITLFLITKMLGKKQVSQLSLFDYVIGISIGNFAAEMTINLESQEMNGIVAVLVFGIIAYLVSYLSMKSIKARRFFVGVPSIIIDNGTFIQKNLMKYKMDINDVLEQLRINGYFDLKQVKYALLEANGTISVLPNEEYRPVTPNDMKLKVSKEGLVANVIIDGKIMYENLKNIKKDENWLLKQLKIQGIKDLSNILLTTVDIDEKVVVYKKVKNIENNDILE